MVEMMVEQSGRCGDREMWSESEMYFEDGAFAAELNVVCGEKRSQR